MGHRPQSSEHDAWWQDICNHHEGGQQTDMRAIVPFHKDISPNGEQLELRKLAHEL